MDKLFNTLYIVATPIGNDADITLRALETLKAVDVIAAEDTRKAKRLLGVYGISPKRLLSHHDQNEQSSAEGLVQLLRQGQSVAYMSDAGMPCISDPGYVLVKTARAAGCPVEVLPGANAALAALALSGLSPAAFTFFGFPPRKAGEQKKLFGQLAQRPETLVFYEAPHRVAETLAHMVAGFGAERSAFVGRELTKIYQEQLALPLGELAAFFAQNEPRGEFVIVISGNSNPQLEGLPQLNLEAEIKALLAQGQGAKQISTALAEQLNLPKRDIYQQVLALTQK